MFRFNRYNIRYRLILFFLVIMMIPCILITSIMYYRSTMILGEKKGDSIVNGLEQTKRIMDSILTDAEYQLASLTTNPDTFTSFKNFKMKPDYLEDHIFQDIWNRIHNLSLSNRNIEAIYIYLYNGKVMFTSYEVKKVIEVNDPSYYQWLNIPVDSQNNSSGWVASYGIPPTFSFNIGSVFLLKKNIQNIYSDKPIGEACIVLSEVSVRSTLLDSIREGKSGIVLLLDNGGKIISRSNYKSNPQLIGEQPYIQRILDANAGFFVDNLGDEKMLMAYTTSKLTGWKYISMIPFSEVILNVREISELALGANVLSAVLAIILAWVFSQSIYKPIKVLKDSMKIAESGNLNIQISEKRKDEFGMLNSGFNGMINQIQRLVEELYHEKLLKKEAELRNLQDQINPHFLYNTLDSLHWMSRLNKMEEVSRLTFSLSNFYRLSLCGGKEAITAKETIQLIQEYLNIQKARYGEKFDVHMMVDESLMYCPVPRLVVQPLVENAIYHGIEKKKGAGNITIKLYSEQSSLVFVIEDDGVGINPEKLKEIHKCLKEARFDDGNNFALVNIHKRVVLAYGEEYGLQIFSVESIGTKAVLTLPLVETIKREEKVCV